MNIRCFITLVFTVGLSLAVPARDYHIQPRIVGGSEAVPHQFPYLVALIGEHCGGTILSERWILTAAHCIYGVPVDEVGIVAGKHDLSKEEFGQQERFAEKFYTHHLFRPHIPGPNDIGLIYLKESLVFSDTVQPVALPETGTIPTGEAIVAGWGSTSYGYTPNFPDRLRFAEVTILDYETCRNALYDIDFDYSNLCSGPLTNKRGHCAGDSGGPLVQEIDGNPTIVGIVSFAFEPCGQPGGDSPPAFVRVSHYISWMQKYMNN